MDISDETHFWIKISGERDGLWKERTIYSINDKTGNQKIIFYGAFSKHKKYSLSFFKEKMDSKIFYSMCKEIIPEIIESLGSNYIIYMDNDSKHISIESLKFYKSNLISIKLGPAYSPDLNPVENLWGLIKREMNNKSFKS